MSRGPLLLIVCSVLLVSIQAQAIIEPSQSINAGGPFEFQRRFQTDGLQSFPVVEFRGSGLHMIVGGPSTDCVQVLWRRCGIDSLFKGWWSNRRQPCRSEERIPRVLLETDFSAGRIVSFDPVTGSIVSFVRVPDQSSGTGAVSGCDKIPDEWIARKLKKRDPSLMISVEDVLPRSKDKPEKLLIDVRPRHDFEKVRIPRSINIDLFAVRTKDFLKAQPIVLVNEGYRYAQIEEETRRLRSSGFTVTILDGGLTNWRHKKGPLEGDDVAQRELNRVPPRVFFEEKDYDHWLVMDATSELQQGCLRLIPTSLSLGLPTHTKELVRQMKAIWERNRIRPFPIILIFDERGKSYERIDRIASSSGLPPVHFLQGGINGYRAFLEQQAILLQHSGLHEKRVGRCTSCP
jgi:rhodanese-related sulfurtransferase